MDWRDRRVQMWLLAGGVLVLVFIAWSLGWFGGEEPVVAGATPGTS
jgi:hypothetical protein